MNTNEIAVAVAAALVSEGYTAKVWTGGEHTRIYVSRKLARRQQDMGFIAIEDGGLNANGLVRNRAGLLSIASKAVAS